MGPSEQRLHLPKTVGPLLLRSFQPTDAIAAAELEYDEAVKRFLGIPQRPKSDWIVQFLAKTVGKASSFAVVADNILVGRAALYRRGLDPMTEKTELAHKRELEIVISKTFWGRKFGRVLAGFLIPMAFHDFGAESVTGTVHPDNEASLKLLKDWNFAYKGISRGPFQAGCHVYELAAQTFASCPPTS